MLDRKWRHHLIAYSDFVIMNTKTFRLPLIRSKFNRLFNDLAAFPYKRPEKRLLGKGTNFMDKTFHQLDPPKIFFFSSYEPPSMKIIMSGLNCGRDEGKHAINKERPKGVIYFITCRTTPCGGILIKRSTFRDVAYTLLTAQDFKSIGGSH